MGLTQSFDSDRTSPNGVFGFEAEWTPADGHSITTSHFYYPSVNDLPEFRSLSRIEWKIRIGFVSGLSVKVGGSYEYDSVIVGSDANDRKYYANIGYDF